MTDDSQKLTSDICHLTSAGARPTTMRALVAWTFGQKRADRAMGWSYRASPADYLPPVSGDGCAGVAEGAALGVKVDTSRKIGVALDPDAEAVYTAASRGFDKVTFGMLVRHGRTGSLPGWGQGMAAVRAAPVMVGRQSGDYHWQEPQVRCQRCGFGRGRRGYAVFWCPLVYLDRGEEIEAARWHYALWHGALEALALHFMGGAVLKRWRVVGVGADAAPWAAGTGLKKRLDSY